MEGMQEGKASPEPAPKQRRIFYLGSATLASGVDGAAGAMGSAARRVCVPRCDVVFYTEDDNVLRLWVKETDSIACVYSKIEKHMGFDVELSQTIKKKSYKLDPSKLVGDDDGMDFAYPVHVKRAAPVVEGEEAIEQSVKKKSTKKAKTARPADEPDEPESAGEGGSSSTAAPGKRRRPPPAGAPRGARGGWMLAQAPIKRDEHGNPLGGTEYQNVYWHQGM